MEADNGGWRREKKRVYDLAINFCWGENGEKCARVLYWAHPGDESHCHVVKSFIFGVLIFFLRMKKRFGRGGGRERIARITVYR